MKTLWSFDLGKAFIGEGGAREKKCRFARSSSRGTRDAPEKQKSEAFASLFRKENAFEPVCPPGGQGNGLRYLTLS